MSTKIEDAYEGAYLDALDLPEGVLVPVEIESIVEPFAEKDSAGKPIKQAIIAFKGKQKRLIVNKTNWRNLKAMFGRDHREWIGSRVQIQRRYLEAARAFGRHFDADDRIVSRLTRKSIDTLKAHFREDLGRDDWVLVVKLKKLFGIE